jgi:hypothetical protein
MSFRLFIYYSALCGGSCAFLGWILGRALSAGQPVVEAGFKGLFLGMLVALGLSLVDALWNRSPGQVGRTGLGILSAVAVGAVGGLLGGMVGQFFYGRFQWSVFLSAGWTVTGLLIGASLGVFDVLVRVFQGQDWKSGQRKIVKCALGGAGGGLLGGIVVLLLREAWGTIFQDRPAGQLWSPSATGFVALGVCIGLAIGLAQVLLREAWIRVEEGFRADRALILNKTETTLGRAESCDLGLFGDAAVERLHARIIQGEDGYLLVDAGTAGGTLLNDSPISRPTPLRSGDKIRVGNSVLSFGERKKRAADRT